MFFTCTKIPQKKSSFDLQEVRHSGPSVLPTPADLIQAPCLKRTEMRQIYVDTEHYINVQFSLLREDFMAPLRNGIRDFIVNGECARHFNDVIFHENIRIGGMLCTHSGIAYTISIRCNKLERGEKRLLHGSLLVLTVDQFETILLATVLSFDQRVGQLTVQFEGEMRPSNEQTFLMVETRTFFAAYRHVLLALQNITTCPFEKQVLKGDCVVEKPAYTSINHTYDFSCLANPGQHIGDVNIFADETWPRCDDIAVNESQLRALKLALTSNFCLIQGPPGTGKTYVGLKIAKCILQNNAGWPILVVCYTNHALDQFLEGICKFQDRGIVRIGGGCENETVMRYNLATLRKEKRRPEAAKILQAMAEIDDKLFGLATVLESTGNRLTDIDLLEAFMKGRHYCSLKSSSPRPLENWLMKTAETTAIKDGVAEVLGAVAPVDDFERLNIANNGNGEWKETKQNKRRLAQKMDKELSKTDVMTSEDEEVVADVWSLPLLDRWCLYRKWRRAYREYLAGHSMFLMKAYNKQCKSLTESTLKTDSAILEIAQVIGMTTTGAASHQRLLEMVRPAVVIVEEAAEVLEAHCLVSIAAGCQHAILIGDHKQLRPSFATYALRDFSIDVSLFERMCDNGVPYATLNEQRRMRPEICDLVRDFYPALRDAPSVQQYEHVRGISRDVFFIRHEFHEEQCGTSNCSYGNMYEAKMVTNLCRYLILQGYKCSQLVILTTYNGQLRQLAPLMDELKIRNVRACVVDNFQGEESDIILLSLVRGNCEGRIGFLATENRVCVALSRARIGLYIVGNMSTLEAHSVLWHDIRTKLEQAGNIGDALPMYCQNHDIEMFQATKDTDFTEMAPNGGCTRMCRKLLSCGHVCPYHCHCIDSKHEEEFECEKMVIKLLPKCEHTQGMPCNIKPETFSCQLMIKFEAKCGHEQMMRCGLITSADKAGYKCEKMVIKLLPKCEHTQAMPCNIKPETFSCQLMIKLEAKCGHEQMMRCGLITSADKAGYKCEKIVDKLLIDCGHTQAMPCKMNPDMFLCQVEVKFVAECGHKKCVQCHMDPKAVSCLECVEEEEIANEVSNRARRGCVESDSGDDSKELGLFTVD